MRSDHPLHFLPIRYVTPAMFPESNTPEPSLIPQTRLQGGFVMGHDTAIEWAPRIENEQFTKDCINRLWRMIENNTVAHSRL